MKKKILIVGANGYLGSKLNEALKQKNFNITCIDNYLYGNSRIIGKSKNQSKIIKKDIRDLSFSFLEKFDAIYCLASLSNNPIKKINQKKIYDISKNYTTKLADQVEKIGNKLIFPSSCSVYGKIDSEKVANERTTSNPLTYYSINKHEIENYLINKSKKNNNFNCTILRPATVFGSSPSMRFDIVINMLIGMSITYRKILLNSDGSAYRPFIYIDDLINFFISSLDLKENFLVLSAGFNSYNYSIKSIANKISKINNSKILLLGMKNSNLHKDDLIKNNKDERSYTVDFSLAKKKINIKPKLKFDEAINKTFKDISKILINNNFESKNFYRLNKIRYLINRGIINYKNLKNKNI